MQIGLLETTLIVLFTVLMVNILFRYLRLPLILGYLAVGALVGPNGIGWIANQEAIGPLSEFGIVLLMFTIGLEFSLSRLLSLKSKVIILGGLQVLLSLSATAAIGLGFKMTLVEASITGAVVAMSSTAVVVKILSEQFEMHAPHGLNALGILLFQDLAVIPVLTVIAALSAPQPEGLGYALFLAFSKGLLAIVFIIGLGRWLLRPIFHLIASTRVIELFTLSVIFIAIGSAWLTSWLGMTLVLGAFLSGIMLGETEFRHQIKSEIRPFRDILLGLFFVSIGMMANLQSWLETWPWIALLVTAIVLGKSLLIFILCLLTGNKRETAARTAIVLAQGGEFGIVIFGLAYQNHLMPADYSQVILAALLISFGLAPLLIMNNKRIAAALLPENGTHHQKEDKRWITEQSHELSNHVIICGFGRVGQHIARFLKQVNVPYLCFDIDPDIIHNAVIAGEPVLFGNVIERDILDAAGTGRAAAIVISFHDVAAAQNILQQLQSMQIKIPSLVRCHDEQDYEILKNHGAEKIIAEAFEESLTLVHYLLQCINIPKQKIHQLIQSARADDYRLLSPIFPGSFTGEHTENNLKTKYLRSVIIDENSVFLNHKICEIDLPSVDIVSFIRNGTQQQISDKYLKPDDALILYGLSADLDEAEEMIRYGKK